MMVKIYVTLTVCKYIINAVSFLAVNAINVVVGYILQSETWHFKNSEKNSKKKKKPTIALDPLICDYTPEKFLMPTFSELDATVQLNPNIYIYMYQ